MKTLITLPITHLLAARLVMAKNDVRYYLNGVLLTDKEMVATNGHHLIRIAHVETETAVENFYDVIIPDNAIDSLCRRLTPGERKTARLRVICLDEGEPGIYQMHVAGHIVQFTPYEAQYPNWQRVYPPENAEVIPHALYHWPYMMNFYTAASILTNTSELETEVQLIQHGERKGASVLFPNAPYASGVLMPKRMLLS